MTTDSTAMDLSALADLRPYHLPDTPAWWPPAPGWWLVGLLLLLVLAVSTWWFVRRWQRQRAMRQALRELAFLRQQDGKATAADMRALSRLLRRFALVQFGHEEVAALTGDAWLRFLDQQGGNGQFMHGPGRQLEEAPYREAPDIAFEPLLVLVEAWVRRNREARV